MIAIFTPSGSPTSAVSSEEATTPSREASKATQPSALIRRLSLPPMTLRLKALPRPLETSMEKITTVSA